MRIEASSVAGTASSDQNHIYKHLKIKITKHEKIKKHLK